MLEKKRRLTKNRYFQYMYKKGNKLNSNHMYIIYLPTKYRPNRYGFVVTNKIGKAVKRNLIKRRLRSIVEEMLSSINSSNNYIVVAKEGICDLSYLELKKEFHTLLKKGGLLANDKKNI